jgi:hypothetical protein
LERLLGVSRGPTGQPRRVEFDTDRGPLAELAELLSLRNGFSVCNAGVQVFRAGDPGVGPELEHWNRADTWKQTYGSLAGGLFCFGQDLFGVQFAITDQRVVTVDPETGTRTDLGDSLESWAAWLLKDPDTNGCRAFATAWQDTHGPLEHHQRLIPWQFFVLGGTYDEANLTAKDSATAMRIRGPVAQTVGVLPEAAELHLRA